MDGLRISDKHTVQRAGIEPMSLAGDCQGKPASTIRPGLLPLCLTCGAFNGGGKLGTLKPAAVRLPPAMEWGCVNWRAHGGGTVPPRVDGVKALPRGGGDADSTRAGEGG